MMIDCDWKQSTPGGWWADDAGGIADGKVGASEAVLTVPTSGRHVRQSVDRGPCLERRSADRRLSAF